MRTRIEFARLWDRHDVRGHKTFHHPQVGTVSLGHQSMQLNGTPGVP